MEGKVKVAENPVTGKILVGSISGNILHAIPTLLDYLNNDVYSKHIVDFHCDNGHTVITFLPSHRKSFYTQDEIWDMISASRGCKVTVGPSVDPVPSL